MSGYKLVTRPCDTVYLYDGSLAGFYNCVHRSVYEREMPLAIRSETETQMGLFPPMRISTDMTRAVRVRNGIARKISPRALELCENIFLSCLDEKEMALLSFLIRGFELGPTVTDNLADTIVATLTQAERHMFHEAHLLSGFIRFADYDGKLVALISPKNFVLPKLAPHFADRYAHETFMIFDKTHNAALVYESGRSRIGFADTLKLPPHDEKEQYYQALWKQFYHTIAIKERENPRCRMSHMPKRYWENMVELQDALVPLPQHGQITLSSSANNFEDTII